MHAHVHNVFSYVGVPVTTRENPMANVCGMHRCCILRVARLWTRECIDPQPWHWLTRADTDLFQRLMIDWAWDRHEINALIQRTCSWTNCNGDMILQGENLWYYECVHSSLRLCWIMDEEMWLKIFIRYDVVLKLGYVMSRDEAFKPLGKKARKVNSWKVKKFCSIDFRNINKE